MLYNVVSFCCTTKCISCIMYAYIPSLLSLPPSKIIILLTVDLQLDMDILRSWLLYSCETIYIYKSDTNKTTKQKYMCVYECVHACACVCVLMFLS